MIFRTPCGYPFTGLSARTLRLVGKYTQSYRDVCVCGSAQLGLAYRRGEETRGQLANTLRNVTLKAYRIPAIVIPELSPTLEKLASEIFSRFLANFNLACLGVDSTNNTVSPWGEFGFACEFQR